MYALVNTMDRVSPYLGTIISLHRTRRYNGSSCYIPIPTCVVELDAPLRRQQGASRSRWALERECRHVALEEAGR